MNKVLIAVAALFATANFAAADSCKEQAQAKNLAGAALNSFMTKCKRDANAGCATQASDKKLAGAAKTSFLKKCVSDTVGE